MLLSAVLLLKHLGLHQLADKIDFAVMKVLKDGKVKTADLGGKSSTTDFTKAVVSSLQ